jgi:hypothetical protein
MFSTGIVKLKAAIAANLAKAWSDVGDFAKSYSWQKKSLALYRFHGDFVGIKIAKGSRPVGLDECRQAAAVAVTKLSLGQYSKFIEWHHAMENGEDAVLAVGFWKDRPKSTQSRSDALKEMDNFGGTIQVLDEALASLYEQAYRQRIRKDWTGLFASWLNIGN